MMELIKGKHNSNLYAFTQKHQLERQNLPFAKTLGQLIQPSLHNTRDLPFPFHLVANHTKNWGKFSGSPKYISWESGIYILK
jgi:hypothetical protein